MPNTNTAPAAPAAAREKARAALSRSGARPVSPAPGASLVPAPIRLAARAAREAAEAAAREAEKAREAAEKAEARAEAAARAAEAADVYVVRAARAERAYIVAADARTVSEDFAAEEGPTTLNTLEARAAARRTERAAERAAAEKGIARRAFVAARDAAEALA